MTEERKVYCKYCETELDVSGLEEEIFEGCHQYDAACDDCVNVNAILAS